MNAMKIVSRDFLSSLNFSFLMTLILHHVFSFIYVMSLCHLIKIHQDVYDNQILLFGYFA